MDEELGAARQQWPIKGVRRDDIELIKAAAAARDATVAEWLHYAVRALPGFERGERLQRPALPNAPKPPDKPALPDKPPPSLEQIREYQAMALELAQAAGRPMPRNTARHLSGMLNRHLRDVRGLAPERPRRPAIAAASSALLLPFKPKPTSADSE